MSSKRLFKFLCLTAFMAIGCSRHGDRVSVKLTIPLDSGAVQREASSTPPPPPLQTLIANVQVPGSPPLVQELDFNDSPAPASIDLTFPGISSGVTVLVQVLGVFQANGGTMQLKYGDTSVTIAGDTLATVNLANSGNPITKQSYMAGRLKLSSGYPTGTLLGLFQPPGGAPKMIVDQSPILSGWFKVFAVNGNYSFDYILKETGETVFSGLNPDLSTSGCTTTSLNGSCPFQSGTNRVRIHKPISVSRSGNSKSPGLRTNGETEYVIGYFGLATGTVCYPNNTLEGVPGLYTDNTLISPLDIDFTATGSLTTPSPTKIEYMGGGTADTSAAIYLGTSSVCSATAVSTGIAMPVYHTLFGNDDDQFAGFRGPWRMVQPFSQTNNQYFGVSLVAGAINLNWSMQPGTGTFTGTATYASGATAIANVTVSTGSAPAAGMSVTGSGIPTGTTVVSSTFNVSTYTVVLSAPTTSSGSTLTFGNITGIEIWTKYNLNIQGTIAAGSANITSVDSTAGIVAGMPVAGSGIPAGAIVTGVSTNSFTISAAASASTSTSISIGTSTSLNGGDNDDCSGLAAEGYQQISGSPLATTASPYSYSGISGVGVSNNINYQFAACAIRGTGLSKVYIGSYIQGQLPYAGDNGFSPFGWAPASSSGAATTISSLGIASSQASSVTVSSADTDIQLATPISGLASGDEVLVTITGQDGAGCGLNTGSFTFARVLDATTTDVKIPTGSWVDQMRSLTMGTPGTAPFCYLQVVKVPQFRTLSISGLTDATTNVNDYSAAAGGIIPFRVNGVLSITGNIDISGSGFKAGTYSSGDNFGAGNQGPSNASVPTGSGGGLASTPSNGAGGGGSIGSGSNGASDALAGSGTGWGNQLAIGGGGGSGGSGSDGGSGGGVLYIAANTIQIPSTVIIKSNGVDGSGTAGGGGGAGSLIIKTNHLDTTSASPVTALFSANGGMGTGFGGSGGGGLVDVQACSVNSLISPSDVEIAGNVGQTGGSQAGFSHLALGASAQSSVWWCQ